jgi:hypothetical protein
VPKIPERTSKGRNVYFGSWFQRVKSIGAWPQSLGQNIIAMGICVGGTFSPHGRQESNRQNGTGTSYNL